MNTSGNDNKFEKLFPSINWSDDEIANYAFSNKHINESKDINHDNVIYIKTELSVEEYMRRNKSIELKEFIKMAKNKGCLK